MISTGGTVLLFTIPRFCALVNTLCAHSVGDCSRLAESASATPCAVSLLFTGHLPALSIITQRSRVYKRLRALDTLCSMERKKEVSQCHDSHIQMLTVPCSLCFVCQCSPWSATYLSSLCTASTTFRRLSAHSYLTFVVAIAVCCSSSASSAVSRGFSPLLFFCSV